MCAITLTCTFVALAVIGLYSVRHLEGKPPPNSNFVVICLLIVFSAYSAVCYSLFMLIMFFFLKAKWFTRRLANLHQTRASLELLDHLVEEKGRFALFLRCFAPEAQFVEMQYDFCGPWMVGMPMEYDCINTLYMEVIRPVEKVMPVFSLFNEKDFTAATLTHKISVPNEAWIETFERYADKAAIVIVIAQDRTASIEYELTWIRANAANRTVLLAEPELLTALEHDHLAPMFAFTFSIRRELFTSSRPSLPENVVKALTSVAQRLVVARSLEAGN